MMSRKKKSEEESGGAPEWMTTYSDLVTLLLTFFILLFSMAVIDKQKFEEVASSLRSSFMQISNGETFNENKGDTIISITPYENAQKDTISEEDDTEDKTKKNESDTSQNKEKVISAAKVNFEKLIEKMGLQENVKVIDEKSVIILRIDSLIMFDSGKAELKDSAKPALEKIGVILKELNMDILVQGHADDRPISTAVFPSNWELSTKRAVNVVKYLADNGGVLEKYLTATGNAEFKPIVPNDTEQNRMKNRRIDIVIAK